MAQNKSSDGLWALSMCDSNLYMTTIYDDTAMQQKCGNTDQSTSAVEEATKMNRIIQNYMNKKSFWQAIIIAWLKAKKRVNFVMINLL